MRVIVLVACFPIILLLVSCRRTKSDSVRSVEQRVEALEQLFNRGTPALTEAEIQKQFERDYAEIESMGLVERAYRDFTNRLSSAAIQAWTIGYLRDSNTVWCDVRYRLPKAEEILQQEFGYIRQGGSNWLLTWKSQEESSDTTRRRNELIGNKLQ